VCCVHECGLHISHFMGECVLWVCVEYVMFDGLVCVLDMLCLMGECVVWPSVCMCVGYVVFHG
jgi:hypothetical protein